MIDHTVYFEGKEDGRWGVGANDNGIILMVESFIGTEGRVLLTPEDVDEVIELLKSQREEFLINSPE